MTRTGWLTGLLAACLLGMPGWAWSAQVAVKTPPEGDGMLIDKDNDGIVDEISAVAEGKNHAMEASAGRIWKQNRKAVFEFPLPETPGTVKKATLRLSLNGKFGCFPEKEGAFGPEIDAYYYLAPEADGTVDLADDNGTRLGTALKAETADTKKYVNIDVTAAVKAAAEAKSAWVGFRLEAVAGAPTESAWRFRTAEFAEKNGKQYHPTLILVAGD